MSADPLARQTPHTGERAPAATPKPRRLRRWCWRVGGLLVMVAVAGGLLYRQQTDPERVRALAERYLGMYVGGPVTVRVAEFSFFDGLTLFDVEVHEATPPAQQASNHTSEQKSTPVFSCRRVHVRAHPWSMLWGQMRIEQIVADQPICTVVRRTSDGTTNLRGLFRIPDAGLTNFSYETLPTVELNDVCLRVISRDADKDRIVEDLRVAVRAIQSIPGQPIYDIVWHEDGAEPTSGHSQLDLSTGRLRNVKGGLPGMSIEGIMLVVNSHFDGVGAWSDMLGLRGTVFAREYDVTSSSPSATLELSNATISIPVGQEELDLPAADRYLRFDDVFGTAQLTGDALVATFRASFHGSPCSVSVTFRGDTATVQTLADVAMDAEISVERLILPQVQDPKRPNESRFIRQLPALAKIFKSFDPHGVFDLSLDISKKARESADFKLRHAEITVRDADASYSKAPYRLERLAGVIEYDDGLVYMRNLRGSHEKGIVTLNGTFSKAQRWNVESLTIAGVGVKLDDDFWKSLPKRFANLRNRFQPEGFVDLHAEIQAGWNPEVAKWRVAHQTSVELRGVTATYDAFPYTLTDLSGTLNLNSTEARLVKLAGRSGGATVEIDGKVFYAGGEVNDVDLRLTAGDVALDDKLFRALPEDMAARVASLQPVGALDVSASIGWDRDHRQAVVELVLSFEDVVVTPQAFPVTVRNVSGKLQMDRGGFTLHDVRGYYGDAVVRVAGTSTTGHSSDITIDVEALVVDEDFRNALPQQHRTMLADWRFDTPLSLSTRWRETASTPSSIETVITLDGATLGQTDWSIPLSEVVGVVRIDESGIRTRGLQARFGLASLQLDLDVVPPGQKTGLTLTATNLTLDDHLRDVLPDAVTDVWNKLQPRGTVNVHLDRLEWSPAHDSEPTSWLSTGYIEFNKVALAGSLSLEGMTGILDWSGGSNESGIGTLDGNLDLASLDVFGFHIGRVHSGVSYAGEGMDHGVLLLSGISGDLAGGRLTSEVSVAFEADGTRYDALATVHGVGISQLIQQSQHTSGLKEANSMTGSLDGQFNLSGVMGNGKSRRGGGRFRIGEGEIYHAPLILAILNVLNLSVPAENAIREAEGEFLVVGDRLRFEHLNLRGASVTLAGGGTITLPDALVDLSLSTVRPSGWSRLPGVSDFMDQASKGLVQLHVTGTLSKPTVSVVPFKGITDEIRRLFQPKKRSRRHRSAS